MIWSRRDKKALDQNSEKYQKLLGHEYLEISHIQKQYNDDPDPINSTDHELLE